MEQTGIPADAPDQIMVVAQHTAMTAIATAAANGHDARLLPTAMLHATVIAVLSLCDDEGAVPAMEQLAKQMGMLSDEAANGSMPVQEMLRIADKTAVTAIALANQMREQFGLPPVERLRAIRPATH